MRIVLDAVGGDYAPREPVKGAVLAARKYKCTVILVGPRAKLEAELARHNTQGLDLPIVDAPEIISMEESPSQAVRRKPNSSHMIGLRLVRDKKAEAFVSAGHSGASMAGALLVLGRLPGIERPALGVTFPTLSTPVLLMDAGATTDCRAENLLQFAQMGSSYAERMLGVSHPRIALLANGEEQNKGDKLVQETHLLLRESNLNFVGNAEPKDVLLNHTCDVVITGGFVGNLVLKMSEAIVSTASKKIMAGMRRHFIPRLILSLSPTIALTLWPGKSRWRTLAGAVLGSLGLLSWAVIPLLEVRRETDYRSYGGVPLFGVKGAVIIAHGKSDALAICNAIRNAKETVESQTVQGLEESIRSLMVGPPKAT